MVNFYGLPPMARAGSGSKLCAMIHLTCRAPAIKFIKGSSFRLSIPWRLWVVGGAIAVTTVSAPAQEGQIEVELIDEVTLREQVVRLQVFLDRAGFSPGRIDGDYGEFTFKALDLYRQAHGGGLLTRARDPGSIEAPDVSDLNLAALEPLYTTYTVTTEDLAHIGNLPQDVEAQSKLKSMPYRSGAEAISEKFHTDIDFLEQLNRGKTANIQAGDILRVPNVEPFELASVKQLQTEAGVVQTTTAKQTSVRIDTNTNMLTLYKEGKLAAAYPVTLGSALTETPLGNWTVSGISTMPNFRHDKSMLQHGQRSDEFHMLPPGPNNPVGVVWIQLNKKGIGIHGTSAPDTIGRSESAGCIRLANWDVVRLARQLQNGVSVEIF